MALLKAFVCQAVLFGLYKLFLEQVVGDHLVPDDLTRNCLVGFVFLLCFGIQLYTDKADDQAEAEEHPKAKSKSRESTDAKKFESTEIPVNHEIIRNTDGWNAEEISIENKESPKSQQVVYSKGNSSSIPFTESEEVAKTSHSGLFHGFSTNVSDKIGVAASTVETSNEQQTKTFPVLNGLSDVYVSEESEEECIQIDECVSKEPEHLVTVEAKGVEAIKPEKVKEAVAECDYSTSNDGEISSTQDSEYNSMIVESQQLITVKSEELQAVKQEPLMEAVMESEYLTSNLANILSSKEFDFDPMIESESQIVNGTEAKSLNNMAETPLNIMHENEMNSIKDGREIEDARATTSTDTSELDSHPKDLPKPSQSVPEMSCISTVSPKTVNKEQTVNKSNVGTSAANTTVPSPRKISASEGVCVTYFPIDISFIYACH